MNKYISPLFVPFDRICQFTLVPTKGVYDFTIIFCDDFNAAPFSTVWQRFRRRLPDAQITLSRHRPKKTFFGRYPLARIDHVFVEPGIDVANIEVPSTELTRVASDHLPLIVDVYFPRQ